MARIQFKNSSDSPKNNLNSIQKWLGFSSKRLHTDLVIFRRAQSQKMVFLSRSGLLSFAHESRSSRAPSATIFSHIGRPGSDMSRSALAQLPSPQSTSLHAEMHGLLSKSGPPHWSLRRQRPFFWCRAESGSQISNCALFCKPPLLIAIWADFCSLS